VPESVASVKPLWDFHDTRYEEMWHSVYLP
jgi:hypothetical protein